MVREQSDPDNPFPAGTRLLGVSLHHGVATLDFSKDFDRLATMGETTESMAQKKLRACLQSVTGVSRMRVTVEGRPFASQVTDWQTPFPVQFSPSESASDGVTRPGTRP